MKHMHINIPYMFVCCANLFVQLPLLKSSMNFSNEVLKMNPLSVSISFQNLCCIILIVQKPIFAAYFGLIKILLKGKLCRSKCIIRLCQDPFIIFRHFNETPLSMNRQFST